MKKLPGQDEWVEAISEIITGLECENKKYVHCPDCAYPYTGRDIVGIAKCGACGYVKKETK